jgi:hypothetical protein
MRLLLVLSIVMSSQAFAQTVYENIKQKSGVTVGVKAPAKPPVKVSAPVKR